MDKYSRPYCNNCKLIYGIGALGHLTNCTKCGHPLALKSFNPWGKVVGAVVLIAIGLVTILLTETPIIWIGAFLWAIGLIFNGFRQWYKIKDLDNPYKSEKGKHQYTEVQYEAKEELKDDANFTIINYGACFHQYKVPKGQGIVATKCPNCSRESRIMT
ncbi:hypothetical protein ACFLYR_00595 [Chloroflexota bacterium]